ncbi:MAG: Mpo1-like protein [Comamonas sp.]
MKTLTDQLSQYADYHRDPRNILTHFFGVPMILFAVVILLSRPAWALGDGPALGGVPLSPAVIAAVLACSYYVLLDLRYGLAMGVVLAAMLAVAAPLAQQATAVWLGWGVGIFVVGWVIQFIGHYYEGRKPAFMDDIVGLLIGPLFVMAEMGFGLGLRREVQHAIEARSGPVRQRQASAS